MKFSIFQLKKVVFILHGQVFVMTGFSGGAAVDVTHLVSRQTLRKATYSTPRP